ncbi:MAG TPA: gliding motility-associated C-terminal domain-containing protein, partial [Saprospiraceae bacterium]|nr:gliding motility-associated C-terminal domain-containing protein [Saprospiraceae bacterium]
TRAGGDFDQDAIVLKIKENGDIGWSQRWDMPGDDAFTSAWADAQGFVYCCGYANAAGDLDAVLTRIAPSGSLLWARRYGGSRPDLLSGLEPGQLNGQEGLLAVGHSTSYGLVYGEMWTLFTDFDGHVRSAKTFAVPERDFAAHHLAALPGGQWVVAASDAHFSAGSPAYLLRMTADGLLSWAYQYRSGGERDAFRRVKTRSGGLAAAGTAATGGDRGAFLSYMGNDGLLLECCPLDAAVDIKSVSPAVQAFVPSTLSLPSSSSQPLWGSAPIDAALRNPCVPIDVSFSLSDTLLRIGECVDILLPDTVAGVHYTLDLQGGNPDAADALHVCYPDCGRFFITRTGQSSVCKKSFSKRVEVGGVDDLFPNAFSPNGDQVNDRFKPLLACPPERMTFEVFDRWGKKVFSTSDPKTLGWDGNFNGQPSPADVYAWRLEYEMLRNGSLQALTEKGDVTLLR